MAALTDAESRELGDAIESVARQIGPQYAAIMEPGDVAQELWAWMLGKGARQLERWRAERNFALLHTQLRNQALRHGEAERRKTLGYDWRDDYTYSRPEVARILPLALDEGTIPGLTGSALHDGPSSKSDPAYGGGMLASIVDVRVAFGKLSESDREFVTTVVALDSDWERVGAVTGMQGNSAYAKYMRILDRMVKRHLGRKQDEDAA